MLCSEKTVNGEVKSGFAIKRAFIGNTHAMIEREGQANYNRWNFIVGLKGSKTGGKVCLSDLMMVLRNYKNCIQCELLTYGKDFLNSVNHLNHFLEGRRNQRWDKMSFGKYENRRAPSSSSSSSSSGGWMFMKTEIRR